LAKVKEGPERNQGKSYGSDLQKKVGTKRIRSIPPTWLKQKGGKGLPKSNFKSIRLKVTEGRFGGCGGQRTDSVGGDLPLKGKEIPMKGGNIGEKKRGSSEEKDRKFEAGKKNTSGKHGKDKFEKKRGEGKKGNLLSQGGTEGDRTFRWGKEM